MTPTNTLREAVRAAINEAIDTHGEFATGAMADAALYAIEAAGWRVVNEGTHLPCNVDLPPGTTIVAGCRLGTLIDALEHRGMSAPRLDATVRGEEG